MTRRFWLLAPLLLTVILWTVSSAAADPQPIINEPTVIWYRGGYSGSTSTLDSAEYLLARRLGDGPFVYEYPVLTVVPLLELHWQRETLGTVNYYSFRAPLSFLLDRVDSALAGVGFWELAGTPQPHWYSFLLHAPNSTIKLRLNRSLRLALTTRTDLLPLRLHGDDQGVLFTPQLSLELVGLSAGFENDSDPLTNRLQVGVGYGQWWSFAGRHRTPGWTFMIGFGILAGV